MQAFPLSAKDIPFLTTEQMVEVDRLMIESYGITLIRMMENAGRGLAHLARSRFLDGNPRGRRVAVLAGTSGNGGGALVAARRLANYGADVRVFITHPPSGFNAVPAEQLAILRNMQLPIITATDNTEMSRNLDLIVDGLVGYSLSGAPYGMVKRLIDAANAADAPILSLDVPSGIDTGTGTIYAPAVRAAATLTLALPKTGFKLAAVQPYLGELYLADISVPSKLYRELGIQVEAIFAENDILQIPQTNQKSTGPLLP